MKSQARWIFLSACACAAVGCGGDDAPADMAIEAGADLVADSAADLSTDLGADSAMDLGEDLSSDLSDPELPDLDMSDPDLSDLDLSDPDMTTPETQIRFATPTGEVVLDEAYYGFDGEDGFWLELHHHSAGGCPTMDAPPSEIQAVLLPSRTLDAQTITMTIYDFEAQISEAFPLMTQAALRLGRLPERGDDPDVLELVEVQGLIAEGEHEIPFEGSVHAIHCASLDG